MASERTTGVRAPAGPDVFEPFVQYCKARLAEDPHLWATALFDEIRELGYVRSYLRLRTTRSGPPPAPPSATDEFPGADSGHSPGPTIG